MARSDPEDCRRRIQAAYDNFSHIDGVHLTSPNHKKLAQKARGIRKAWEPIIFKRSAKACPPHGACEQIAEFQEELVDALAKFEGHAKREGVAAQSILVPEVGGDDSFPLLFGLLLTGAVATAFLRNT